MNILENRLTMGLRNHQINNVVLNISKRNIVLGSKLTQINLSKYWRRSHNSHFQLKRKKLQLHDTHGHFNVRDNHFKGNDYLLHSNVHGFHVIAVSFFLYN